MISTTKTKNIIRTPKIHVLFTIMYVLKTPTIHVLFTIMYALVQMVPRDIPITFAPQSPGTTNYNLYSFCS